MCENQAANLRRQSQENSVHSLIPLATHCHHGVLFQLSLYVEPILGSWTFFVQEDNSHSYPCTKLGSKSLLSDFCQPSPCITSSIWTLVTWDHCSPWPLFFSLSDFSKAHYFEFHQYKPRKPDNRALDYFPQSQNCGPSLLFIFSPTFLVNNLATVFPCSTALPTCLTLLPSSSSSSTVSTFHFNLFFIYFLNKVFAQSILFSFLNDLKFLSLNFYECQACMHYVHHMTACQMPFNFGN